MADEIRTSAKEELDQEEARAREAAAREAAAKEAAKAKDAAADIVWQEAIPDSKPESQELVRIAWLIVHHPTMRARYFAEPTALLKEKVGKRPKDAAIGEAAAQHRLALLVELLINADDRLISSKETFHERESFLKEGVQDPQQTFGAVVEMSKTTFYIGVGLVFVGVAFAFGAAFADVIADPDTPQQITLGALGAFFGGSGVVTTLLAVFRASTKELRTITSDMAKIHMVLTGYGAETTNLRKIEVTTGEEAATQNAEFRKITKHAVSLLPSDPPRAEDKGGEETREQTAAPP